MIIIVTSFQQSKNKENQLVGSRGSIKLIFFAVILVLSSELLVHIIFLIYSIFLFL